MKFSIGDVVSCARHGIGRILSIETVEIGGMSQVFYVIKGLSQDLQFMIPVKNEVKLRSLPTDQEIENVYQMFKDHTIEGDAHNKKIRYNIFMEKVRTGELLAMADVVRQLMLLGQKNDLTYSEKKLLGHTKEQLICEIALSGQCEEDEVGTKITLCFSA